jgi:hypothetical protein
MQMKLDMMDEDLMDMLDDTSVLTLEELSGMSGRSVSELIEMKMELNNYETH